eukprot:1679485-Amphidinium_carterae.1
MPTNSLKKYCEKRSSLPDQQCAARRPFDYEILDQHHISYVELKDLPMLPKHLMWCWVTWVQSLLRSQCRLNSGEEHEELQFLHEALGRNYGPPASLSMPSDVIEYHQSNGAWDLRVKHHIHMHLCGQLVVDFVWAIA